MKLDNILIVVDPTIEKDLVVERAKMLFAQKKAKVELFINNYFALSNYVQYPIGADSSFYEKYEADFVEYHLRLLQSLKTEFESLGLSVKTDFRQEKDLAIAIIDKVSESRPDMVLKSTHSHNWLNRSLITNTDWRLIRHCAAPLLLVKPIDWHPHGSVIASVDPLHNNTEQGKLDHELVSMAEFVAEQFQQTPRVFHSYQPLLSHLLLDGSEYSEVATGIAKLHEQKVDELLATHGIEPAHVKLASGELVVELLKFLDDASGNMLIIGAYSRQGMKRLLVGSSAEEILENLRCDVLIIKPHYGN